MVAIPTRAKPDTVLYLDATAGTPQTDYGQLRTNLTNNGTYLSEANSARSAIAGSREIAMIWDIASGQTGTLLELGNAVSHSYRVLVSGASVECYENGTLRVSAAIGGLAVSEQQILIVWSIHPDGTNTRSELLVHNLASGNAAVGQATHASGTVSATDTLTVGARFGGSSGFADPLDFRQIRIGWRFRTPTENQLDSNAVSISAPSLTQTTRTPPLAPDRGDLDVASEGSFVGPAALWSGHAFEQSDRRLVSPILNFRPQNPVTVTNAFANVSTAWWKLALDDEDMHVCIAMLWRRPVPLKVNRAHVRAWLRTNNTAVGAPAEARVRVYSLSGLPVADALGEKKSTQKWHRTAQGTRASDDAVNVGGWVNLGALDLAVDDQGFTWLFVAASFDQASAQLATSELFVHAVTVDPYHDPSSTNAFEFTDP